MNELKWKAAELGLGLLGALLAWLGAKVATLIDAHIQNTYVRGTLARLNDTVWTVVKDVQQTIVQHIKAASLDGHVSVDEAEKIRAAALASVKSYLGAKGLAQLGKILGLDAVAVDAFLGTKIEAAVHDLRVAGQALNGQPASASIASPANPR